MNRLPEDEADRSSPERGQTQREKEAEIAASVTLVRIDAAGKFSEETTVDRSGAADPVLAEASRLHWEAEEETLLTRRVGVLAAGVWFCGGLLALYTLYIGRNLFIPIAVATFAYLTLRPIIRAASKIGMPPAVSAAGVLAALALTVGIAFYLIAEPAQSALRDAPQALTEARDRLTFLFERLESVNVTAEEIADTADDDVPLEEQPVPVQIRQSTWTATSPILTGTGNILSLISIAAALLYFLMATGDDLLRKLTSTIPTFSSKRRFVEVLVNVQEGLSSYLACVTIINTCLGAAVGTAMWLLGMPAPLMWGVAAMLLNFLPIFGALCGIAASFFVALVSFDHMSWAFVVAGTYLTLTSLEGQFITPSILGRSMHLSSAVVFLSIVIWGWMWGIAGIFLAVPILLTLAMVSEKLEALAPLSVVISGRHPDPHHRGEPHASHAPRERQHPNATAQDVRPHEATAS